jgi:hypothetical protein
MRLGFASVSGLLLVGAARVALAEEAPAPPELPTATSSAGSLTVGETTVAVGGFVQADAVLVDQAADTLTLRPSDPDATSGYYQPSPAETAIVFLWLVLHDSRGGTDFASYTLTVVP